MMDKKIGLDKKLMPFLLVPLILFQFAFLEQCALPGVVKHGIISLETDKRSYVLTEDVEIEAVVKNSNNETLPIRTKLIVTLPDGSKDQVLSKSFNLYPNETRTITKTYPLSLESLVGSYKVKATAENAETNELINRKGVSFTVKPPVRFKSIESGGNLIPGGSIQINMTLENKASKTMDGSSLRINGTFRDGENFIHPSKEKLVSIGAEMEKTFSFDYNMDENAKRESYRYTARLYYKEGLWDTIQGTISIEYPVKLTELDIANDTLILGEVQNLTFHFSNHFGQDYPNSNLTVRFRIGETIKGRESANLGTIKAYEEFKKSILWDTSQTTEGRHHIDAWIKSSGGGPPLPPPGQEAINVALLFNKTNLGSFVVRREKEGGHSGF